MRNAYEFVEILHSLVTVVLPLAYANGSTFVVTDCVIKKILRNGINPTEKFTHKLPD